MPNCLDDREAEAISRRVRSHTPAPMLVTEYLRQWCRLRPQPTVLMLDEVDALVGDTLVSLLRQLRAGYPDRPAQFPQSLILCGVRDLHDYRIQSTQARGVITGGSAFNIKAKSLRLGNFSQQDIAALYRQHTEATGQRFTDEALESAWTLTEGQPWLVNALAHEATHELRENRDRTRPISAEAMAQAAENVILSRATHLDQLTDKLQEARVRHVIEPILAGAGEPEKLHAADVQYVEDLGLITSRPQLRIANRIYREIIPRELVWTTQVTITHQTEWYVRPDGTLDVTKLLGAFQEFFRQHSEHWLDRFDYREAGPQLLLQAFLQRVINSGGRIEREYGLGRRRTDLLMIWPGPTGVQRVVLEVKVVRSLGRKAVAAVVAQTSEYMDTAGATEGHLVLFDRRPKRSWRQRIYRRRERDALGRVIFVWGA